MQMGPRNRKATKPKIQVERKPPLLLSAYIGVFVALILAVAIGYCYRTQKNFVAEETNTNVSSGPTFTEKSFPASIVVIDKAYQLEKLALTDVSSVPKAQAAAEAHFVEGRILVSTYWNIEAVRRQALSNGATDVSFVNRYSSLHLVQHLEVNAILWARILLQLGHPYARQLEAKCKAENQLSSAIRNDPTIVPRLLVAKLLAKCLIEEDALASELVVSSYRNNLTLAHFLAYFGDTSLISYARTAIHETSIDWEATDFNGRNPAMLAALRGYNEAAMLHGGAPIAKLEPPPRTSIVPSMGDTGGWGGSAWLGAGTCDIHIVDRSVITDERMRVLMSNEVPLLVRNGSSRTFSRLKRLLEKTAFVRNFANMTASVGEVPYQRSQATTVLRYVEQLEQSTDYLFQSLPIGHPLRSELESHFPTWGGRSYPEERQVQLAIGPKGSGASPHYHKAAINTLFYGHKKWFLFLPKDAIYSSSSSASWLSRGLNESRTAGRTIYECEQRPGELMFIPDFWGHATLNLEPSVAVASEYVTPRMEFEIMA